jgi:hypothetical protein
MAPEQDHRRLETALEQLEEIARLVLLQHLRHGGELDAHGVHDALDGVERSGEHEREGEHVAGRRRHWQAARSGLDPRDRERPSGCRSQHENARRTILARRPRRRA